MTKDEALKKAFKQAFQLGQDYWYQADHEYVSQNKKSDVTRAKFEQLMEDAIKEALMSDTDGAQPAVTESHKQEQLMRDHINYGMSVTQGGKRIDPMSIYKEPEQEPVALETVYETIIQWDEGGGKRSRRELARRIVSLYTTPPQRKPLTLDELWRVFTRSGLSQFHQRDSVVEYKYQKCIEEFARAIEAAHGIKGEA